MLTLLLVVGVFAYTIGVYMLAQVVGTNTRVERRAKLDKNSRYGKMDMVSAYPPSTLDRCIVPESGHHYFVKVNGVWLCTYCDYSPTNSDREV